VTTAQPAEPVTGQASGTRDATANDCDPVARPLRRKGQHVMAIGPAAQPTLSHSSLKEATRSSCAHGSGPTCAPRARRPSPVRRPSHAWPAHRTTSSSPPSCLLVPCPLGQSPRILVDPDDPGSSSFRPCKRESLTRSTHGRYDSRSDAARSFNQASTSSVSCSSHAVDRHLPDERQRLLWPPRRSVQPQLSLWARGTSTALSAATAREQAAHPLGCIEDLGQVLS
jgi:hypothetical protein